MRVGFLVSSVSRKAGGLFQSVRGLPRRLASTNADVRCLGSATNRVLSICRSGSRFLFRHFVRECARGATQTSSSPQCLTPISTSVRPRFVEILLCRLTTLASADGSSLSSSSAWHVGTMGVRNAMWKKRVAALLYENQHLRGAACLRALSEAEARSIRSYGLRNPICVIPNGVDLPDLANQCEDSAGQSKNSPLPRPTSSEEKTSRI